MTAIIGMVSSDTIIMGSDSQVTDSNGLCSYDVEKVFIRETPGGRIIFGVSGDAKAINLLKHFSFDVPKKNYDQYFDADIHKEIRDYLEGYGFSYGRDEDENDYFDLIIGHKNRIYTISSDGDTVSTSFFAGIGSGSPYALGTLYAHDHYESSRESDLSLVRASIDAAKHFDAHCGGQTVVVQLDD